MLRMKVSLGLSALRLQRNHLRPLNSASAWRVKKTHLQHADRTNARDDTKGENAAINERLKRNATH